MAANYRFTPPLFGFRFHVSFTREPIAESGGGAAAGNAEPLCEGDFSEITGLEASMEPKAIKEGGINYGAHQRAGQVAFATVVLKRGMTTARDLWKWWELFAGAGTAPAKNGALAHRLTVRITHKNAKGEPQIQWRLERAMPVKFKAADFNGRATEIGVEELHFVHEGLFAEAPATAPPAGSA
jgi:phage tail-like protein